MAQSKWFSVFDNWLTNKCLDIYDWYTKGIAEMHADYLKLKETIKTKDV